LAIDFLAVLAGTQLAVFLGAVASSRPLKVLLLLFGLGALGYLFAGTAMGTAFLVEMGGGFLETEDFKPVALGTAVAVVGVIGLLFVWSVAVVSPPAANRALLVRLYSFALWLGSGAAAAYMSRSLSHHAPALVWLGLTVLLFCLQILIAINERDHWGTRVARTIPRNRLWRLPAFLFYSGAAGGVAYGVLMIALSVGAVVLWHGRHPFLRGADAVPLVAEVMTALGLYTLCYGLTGVLCRTVLMARQVKPLFTWVVALLLMGLGSTLPYMIAYLIHFDTPSFQPEEHAWWLLPNPFVSVYDDVMSRATTWREAFNVSTVWFTGGWATLVTALCMPWFIRQVVRFRPPAAGKAGLVAEKPGRGRHG
jgi:hypothetical protein